VHGLDARLDDVLDETAIAFDRPSLPGSSCTKKNESC
jgi:hypothetical protein